MRVIRLWVAEITAEMVNQPLGKVPYFEFPIALNNIKEHTVSELWSQTAQKKQKKTSQMFSPSTVHLPDSVVSLSLCAGFPVECVVAFQVRLGKNGPAMLGSRALKQGGGGNLPGTATAATPAEAARVGASWVGLLARLALLGRCSSPRR